MADGDALDSTSVMSVASGCSALNSSRRYFGWLNISAKTWSFAWRLGLGSIKHHLLRSFFYHKRADISTSKIGEEEIVKEIPHNLQKQSHELKSAWGTTTFPLNKAPKVNSLRPEAHNGYRPGRSCSEMKKRYSSIFMLVMVISGFIKVAILKNRV